MGHFGDAQFDFVGLGLFGEDGSERLGIDVCQLSARHITTVVGVSAGVGVLNSASTQAVEFVEAADGGEPDPVVDLADLLQRA